jgi:hypothetical protein
MGGRVGERAGAALETRSSARFQTGSNIPRAAIATTLLLACGASEPSAGVTALLRLQQIDTRVQSIGYRLAVHGAALCAPVPLPGFVVHDLALYDRTEQPDARAAFGLDDRPHILAVAADSPAAAAGITPQDALVSIDGAPVPPRTAPAASFDRVAAIDNALATAAGEGTLALGLVRDGVARTVRLTLERGCPSRFDVRDSQTDDAAADGHYIQITTAYAATADSDDALAIVLAHELAHNILGHRARLESEHVQHGMLQLFGRNARLTRETELEADRLSIRLVAAAGYSVDAAIAWRKRSWGTLTQELFRSPTHPSAHERLAALEAESQMLAR